MRRTPLAAATTGLAALALTAGSCGTGTEAPSSGAPAAPGESVQQVAGVPVGVTLALDFDDTFGPENSNIVQPLSDGTAQVMTHVTTAGGARVRRHLGADGTSARFGGLATRPLFPGAAAVPAAAVVVRPTGLTDGLSPDAQPFSFGADVLVEQAAGPSDAGDNVVQRGLWSDTAQYKVQLDRDVPSCRLAGPDGEVVVNADQRVLPGRWYRVRCARAGQLVTLTLATVDQDGRTRPVGTWTEQGPIGPLQMPREAPLSIGAKVSADGVVVAVEPDPFDGLVDNVVVDIQPG
ncbi:MAG: hypothetical protein JWN84_2958 [Nocardioides sp.]|nr:hypothetical protein [Nocardioides sp.]